MIKSEFKKYKLIAFDIDGTILDHRNKVCDRLKNVVKDLMHKGYLCTLVSARIPVSVLEVADELGLPNQGVIALNGSLITNQEHDILDSQKFLVNRIENILKTLDKNISINYYDDFNWIVRGINKYTEIEARYTDTKYILYEEYDNLHKVNKVTLIGETDMLLAAQKSIINNDPTLLVSMSHPHYLEITCSTISKLSGLDHYTKLNNLTLDNVIAFGDGENDIPMLSNVGLGIAMGNAKDHVKAASHDVTDHHHHEQGVAKYLEKLLHNGIL